MSGKYLTRIIVSLVLTGLVVLTACSNASAANAPASTVQNVPSGNTSGNTGTVAAPNPVVPKNPSGRIKATWITVSVAGDSVTIPVSELSKNIIIHFTADSPQGKMPFMAYLFEGKTYVRADICPPCRSYNFSLEKDILICDTCGSRFKAATGEGVSGACVNYPKASVAWVNSGDNIVVKTDDLKAAYLETLKPG